MKAIPHNYRSDITLIEIFYRYDEKKNEMVATEIPDIEIDFEFTYRAEDHREFTAGRKAGTYFNCKPVSNNSIEVYIPLSRRQLGTGLVGGGTLSSNVTLSLEEVATEGTYTKVHIDALGRVKQGECLGVADIPDLPWSKLTGHPTTIAGYGITDAKISGGTITLGGNSITPLTAHQSLAGYYMKVESDMRYLSRSGGSMLNTNLVGNLNADMLDGKHLAEILSSNVASATKLQTPRTLWGQSFNGTANVSGNMTGGHHRKWGNPFDQGYLLQWHRDQRCVGRRNTKWQSSFCIELTRPTHSLRSIRWSRTVRTYKTATSQYRTLPPHHSR